MKLNWALEDYVSDALYGSFDGGQLKIFGDSLIVTIDLPSPAFNPATNGAKTKSGIWQSEATGSGIASTCKFESADKTKVLTGTVTQKGEGGDLELDNVNIMTGQMVTVADGEGLIV